MSADNSKTRVLVTGASGFVASHCVKQLLKQNYIVRGTVRSLKNEHKVKPVRDLAKGYDDRLELVEADLELPESWPKAVEGCDYVLHVASPFPLEEDNAVIQTAVNGTLNVLKACAAQNTVKKVVLTSSCAAVNEGHEDENRSFDENDWTVIDSKKVQSYARSKTVAEKSAWDFVQQNTGNKFKLTVINPTFVMGPVLIDVPGASISFFNNEVPAIPPLEMGMVDVRDVAKAHIRAMQRPESDGHRILAHAETVSFGTMVKWISKEFRSQGYRTPFIMAPYFFVWIWSFVDKEASASLSRLNRTILFDTSKSKKLLEMDYYPVEKSLIEMCYSLVERGIVGKRGNYKGPKPSEYE